MRNLFIHETLFSASECKALSWVLWKYSVLLEDNEVKSLLCPTLCVPMDCSLPESSVHGIFQARILEWVAISFSNAWKWNAKVKSLSHVRLLATPWIVPYQAPPSMRFSRQEYWSGSPLPSPLLVNTKTDRRIEEGSVIRDCTVLVVHFCLSHEYDPLLLSQFNKHSSLFPRLESFIQHNFLKYFLSQAYWFHWVRGGRRHERPSLLVPNTRNLAQILFWIWTSYLYRKFLNINTGDSAHLLRS